VEFRKERARRVHQRNHKLKGRSLRVTEYSGGEDCAEEGTERQITEDSVKLFQEGIERVQRVHKKNSISSSEIREVSRRRHSQSF
jgi:hypothetical protein